MVGWKVTPVNALLRQLHGVKSHVADLVTVLLHRHVKPTLLLHGVTLALVVTSGVSLVGLLSGSVVEPFAHENTARGAGGDGDGIAVGNSILMPGADNAAPATLS